MFKRANPQSGNDDEFIDISERLAPYGDGDLMPDRQERLDAAPTHTAALAGQAAAL